MKTRLTHEVFFLLIGTKTVEQFLVTKELLGIDGPFNECDSRDLATVFVVNHRNRLADELCSRGIFKVGDYFVLADRMESSGRQAYITKGMDELIAKHYKPKSKQNEDKAVQEVHKASLQAS